MPPVGALRVPERSFILRIIRQDINVLTCVALIMRSKGAVPCYCAIMRL